MTATIGYIMMLTIKRGFAVSSLCKKRPINHIGVSIYPYRKVTHPFYLGIDFTNMLLCRAI